MFDGGWEFEESDPLTQVSADATGNGNVLGTSSGWSQDATEKRVGSASISSTAQVSRACNAGQGCTDSDFDYTATDFTCGQWHYPTPDGPQDDAAWTFATDQTNGSALAGGWGIRYNKTTDKVSFTIDPGTGEESLVAAGTYPSNAWYAVAVKFTTATKLMQMQINGTVEAGTTTASGGPEASGNFAMCNAASQRCSVGKQDDGWCAHALIRPEDVRRLHACGLKGAECQCAWATDPTQYVDKGNHVDEGGIIAGTMPPCNQACPL